MRRACQIASVAILMLLAGCATRQTAPSVYRLDSRILIPPGVLDGSASTRTFDFPLQKPGCRASSDAVRIQPRRHSLRVMVRRDALLQHPAPWLAEFTANLCLAPEQAESLAKAIVESVPMEATAASRLLHAGSAVLGYVDLVDGYRLKLVTPILREGATPGASATGTATATGTDHAITVSAKASPDFLGYEISWYAVESGRIRFLTAEAHVGEKVVVTDAPRSRHFEFAGTNRAFRMFYLTRVSQADHNVAVLSAPGYPEFERLTPAFASDPDACRKAPPGGCEALPKDVAVTPYIRITANGAPLDVMADSHLGQALRTAGVSKPADVLGTLTVQRFYQGKLTAVAFDRTRPDILSLPLAGGEAIRW